MTDVIPIEDAKPRRTQITVYDDLIYQLREIELISDLMSVGNDIDDNLANGLGTMLRRMACNAADLAEEARNMKRGAS